MNNADEMRRAAGEPPQKAPGYEKPRQALLELAVALFTAPKIAAGVKGFLMNAKSPRFCPADSASAKPETRTTGIVGNAFRTA